MKNRLVNAKICKNLPTGLKQTPEHGNWGYCSSGCVRIVRGDRNVLGFFHHFSQLETQMGYIEQNLSSGEAVLYRTRLHWTVMVTPCIGAVLLGAAGIGLLAGAVSESTGNSGNSGVFVGAGVLSLVIAAICILTGYVKRAATEMAVTNKRVLVKRGVLTRRSIEIMLAKIESIAVDQTLTGRMFDFGTIMVRGTGGTPEPFAKIAHPLEFRRRVQEEIDKLQDKQMVAVQQD
jgi:membrane protein YdbS with pleckstrin-like domain